MMHPRYGMLQLLVAIVVAADGVKLAGDGAQPAAVAGDDDAITQVVANSRRSTY